MAVEEIVKGFTVYGTLNDSIVMVIIILLPIAMKLFKKSFGEGAMVMWAMVIAHGLSNFTMSIIFVSIIYGLLKQK